MSDPRLVLVVVVVVVAVTLVKRKVLTAADRDAHCGYLHTHSTQSLTGYLSLAVAVTASFFGHSAWCAS